MIKKSWAITLAVSAAAFGCDFGAGDDCVVGTTLTCFCEDDAGRRQGTLECQLNRRFSDNCACPDLPDLPMTQTSTPTPTDAGFVDLGSMADDAALADTGTTTMDAGFADTGTIASDASVTPDASASDAQLTDTSSNTDAGTGADT